MPNYVYICYDCLKNLEEKLGRESSDAEKVGNEETPGAVFETVYSMEATKDEIYAATECPMCEGHTTEQTMIDCDPTFYNEGYGWHDRSGIRRDMNLHSIETDDPYKEHRVAGEADDLKSRLKKGPQKKSIVFDPNAK